MPPVAWAAVAVTHPYGGVTQVLRTEASPPRRTVAYLIDGFKAGPGGRSNHAASEVVVIKK